LIIFAKALAIFIFSNNIFNITCHTSCNQLSCCRF